MEVKIDFDEASREWRKNKVEGPDGTFEYRCGHIVAKTQQPCQKVVSPFYPIIAADTNHKKKK